MDGEKRSAACTEGDAAFSCEDASTTISRHDINVVVPPRTVPEEITDDISTEFIANKDICSSVGESASSNTKPAELSAVEVLDNCKPDEEQLSGMEVLDDDSPRLLDVKDTKKELSAKSNEDVIEKEQLQPEGLNVVVKYEPKFNDAACGEADDKTKLKHIKTPSSPIQVDEKPGVTTSANTDSTILTHCAIRHCLSNENFVLQLDSTDAIDSYLDKTVAGAPQEKIESADKDDKDGAADVMKENKVELLNAPSAKVVETDALILTADEELETEMASPVKRKKDSVAEEPAATDLITEKECGLNAAAQKESASGDANKIKAIEVSTVEAVSVVDLPEAPNLHVGAVEISHSNDKHKVSTETIKVASSSDIKSNKDCCKKTCSSSTESKKSNNPSKVLWVSNVTQSVKATDLKQYISKIGKVITAKVVTDGKNCYGYVVMDNSQDANECLRTLNNAYFEGRKISLSFLRPTKSTSEKSKDIPKPPEEDKSVPGKVNETDDTKMLTTKDAKPSRTESEKRRRSPSRSHSEKISKRRSSHDPLTTKFETRSCSRHSSKRRSRSSSRHHHKDCIRERLERDRFKRKLMEEQRRNRDEMFRQMQREEKHREMEFKLEQERRKLQLERELFEKERRELTRLDAERRKIEKERLEVLQQRTILAEEMEKSRMKRKADDFNLSSTIVKLQEPPKAYEKRKGDDNCGYRKAYEKMCGSKHPLQKSDREDRKPANDSKSSSSSTVHHGGPKADRVGKDNRSGSKSKRGDEFKPYEHSAPPPPKLTDEFDLASGRKMKHSDRKHEYPEGKPHGDRKSERGGRKIEVIDRKFYPDRPGEGSERKHERIYRKADYEDRKLHVFPERKYEYVRETKRYREEGYSERDNAPRAQWAAPVNCNEPWRVGSQGPVGGTSTTRYPEGSFSTAPSYPGPSRMPPFYYHPVPTSQEYPRYDHCSQIAGRKY